MTLEVVNLKINKLEEEHSFETVRSPCDIFFV